MTIACVGQTDLQRAREAVDAGDRQRALDYYVRVLADDPDNFDVRLEYTLVLGREWSFSGNDRGPLLENLEILHAQRPDNERVRQLYGMMLLREGQAAAAARLHDEAEALYLRAADVNPAVGTPYYHLGVLQQERGLRDAAFESFVTAAAKRPPIPDLYLRLGRAYLERDDLDRAIHTLGLVGELRGTSTFRIPEAECDLARAYARRGERREALDHLQRAGPDCDVEVR